MKYYIMKHYINGKQVPRKQFFEFLKHDVYHDWINNASSDFCFEDYYGFVKEKYEVEANTAIGILTGVKQ